MRKIQLPEKAMRPMMGPLNEHFRTIEKLLGIRIYARGRNLFLEGDPDQVTRAERVFNQVTRMTSHGRAVTSTDIQAMCRLIMENPDEDLSVYFDQYRIKTATKRPIYPKSANQKLYIDAIRKHDIVFAIGPAGTGKTFLAMAMAVEALLNREVSRLILTRPAVEAGERLGFLPGTMLEKVHPYLRPLYDALYTMMDIERVDQLHQKGIIEVAPLAYMRGRTLNDAFIILDEAQNTTHEQMKMFLTRIGFSSKAVITGDITQIDLPEKQVSGLKEAIEILHSVEGIAFIHFEPKDVVRHPLVRKIIEAYELHEKRKTDEPDRKSSPAETKNAS